MLVDEPKEKDVDETDTEDKDSAGKGLRNSTDRRPGQQASDSAVLGIEELDEVPEEMYHTPFFSSCTTPAEFLAAKNTWLLM